MSPFFANCACPDHPVQSSRRGFLTGLTAVGLGAALDYVDRIGRPQVFAHEQGLMSTLLAGLGTVPGLALVGTFDSPVAGAAGNREAFALLARPR